MPIVVMHHFEPKDCQANPDALFFFGDNYWRTGHRGQAIIRNEPNAVGIITKRIPAMEEKSFLRDEHIEDWRNAVADAFVRVERHLSNGGTVFISSAGLGAGLADLPRRAPKIFGELQARISELKMKYG